MMAKKPNRYVEAAQRLCAGFQAIYDERAYYKARPMIPVGRVVYYDDGHGVVIGQRGSTLVLASLDAELRPHRRVVSLNQETVREYGGGGGAPTDARVTTALQWYAAYLFERFNLSVKTVHLARFLPDTDRLLSLFPEDRRNMPVSRWSPEVFDALFDDERWSEMRTDQRLRVLVLQDVDPVTSGRLKRMATTHLWSHVSTLLADPEPHYREIDPTHGLALRELERRIPRFSKNQAFLLLCYPAFFSSVAGPLALQRLVACCEGDESSLLNLLYLVEIRLLKRVHLTEGKGLSPESVKNLLYGSRRTTELLFEILTRRLTPDQAYASLMVDIPRLDMGGGKKVLDLASLVRAFRDRWTNAQIIQLGHAFEDRELCKGVADAQLGREGQKLIAPIREFLGARVPFSEHRPGSAAALAASSVGIKAWTIDPKTREALPLSVTGYYDVWGAHWTKEELLLVAANLREAYRYYTGHYVKQYAIQIRELMARMTSDHPDLVEQFQFPLE